MLKKLNLKKNKNLIINKKYINIFNINNKENIYKLINKKINKKKLKFKIKKQNNIINLYL